ncbi:MAG: glycerophosphodiester phosphodiesterase family protein [Hyphomonas sp.]|uniref:glycerophosphodiester phosphodiesterase family protein n=1 Tax=Hyphomonas sp. TaxID=87 RepID=UPI003267CD8E
MNHSALLVVALILLSGCGPSSDVPQSSAAMPATANGDARLPLPEYFDCLRENGGVVIAAHRGGPADGYPENAIETMQYNFDHGVRVFEIDIAETRDGVLTLMHDDRLNRTTTGRGYVSDISWEDLSSLTLVDNSGQRTRYAPPKLTDALIWARNTGAILELDRKKTTSFANIAEAVYAAGAEENIIMISYNDDEAAEIAAIDPAFMMTASVRGGRDISALEARGVDSRRLIGWTGTDRPDAAAWDRNARNDVESAFGTLGRSGERLDDIYLADGNGSEFQDLAEDGLVMLATDRPLEAAEAMTADDIAIEACGR